MISHESTQADKAERFASLHERAAAFILPNPWDAGTARLLELCQFEALATTSAGCAFAAGHADGRTGRDAMLGHLAAISAASELPVSADLADCFGDEPETVADTIRAAAERGVVGGSVEDRSYRETQPIRYPVELAAERVRAAAEAARALPFRFTLTARCENFLVGHPDLGDTIRRLQAYQEAGADVLYAPGISTREQIRAVTSSVDRPVNVVMGLTAETLPLAELEALGVRRVSLGSTLARVAFGAFLAATEELRDHGTFQFARHAVPFERIDGLLAREAA